MREFNAIEIGERFKCIRKEKGLVLKNLVEKELSTATINRIENGYPYVSLDKYHRLASKLGESFEEITNEKSLHETTEAQNRTLKWRLHSIRHHLEGKKFSDALELLDKIQLDQGHMYAATVQYLKGKCFYLQGAEYTKAHLLEKARKNLLEAIHFATQNNSSDFLNVLALSYNDLAAVYYYEGNYLDALDSVEKGILAFQEDGEQQSIKDPLGVNKALYLVHLKRFAEAKQTLKKIDIHSIQKAATKAAAYELLARIHQHDKSLDEAQSYALKGLEIGEINHLYDQIFDLWNRLGSIQIEMGDHELAEISFQTALVFRDKILNDQITASTFIEIGQLYIEQQKWDKAEKAIREAIELAKGTKDLRYIEALVTLGDFYKKQDQPYEAIESYEEAFVLSETQNHYVKQHNISLKLCDIKGYLTREKYYYYLEMMYKAQKNI